MLLDFSRTSEAPPGVFLWPPNFSVPMFLAHDLLILKYMGKKSPENSKPPDENRTDSQQSALISSVEIEPRILMMRGQRVMLDADLADLYGVTTKRLNEQVKRNRSRFPQDFIFKLHGDEWAELVAKCDRFKNMKHSTVLPNTFTEHGAVMLANILKSKGKTIRRL
jgi:hypothetical protein